MWTTFKNWLNARYGLDAFYTDRLRTMRVPKNINIFYTLGFLAVIAYGVQVLSGIILLIHYVPHPDHAFRSVQEIMTTIPYGWLFRQMHAVGSNLLITVIALHMLTVFLMGNYKRPRELTWLGGGLSLLFALLFGLSGYLLPWSQLSYWATTVTTSIPTAFPVIGEPVTQILRGGHEVSGVTLSRFFALHVAVLPPVFLALMMFHLFLISRTGISATPFGLADEEKRPLTHYVKKSHPDGAPYFPVFFRKQMFMFFLFFAAMFFVITFFPTLFFPPEANVPADPLRTPPHIRPEWYLIPPYQLMKLIPNKFLGISLLALAGVVFLFWPFLDTQKEKNVLKRPVLRGIFVVGLFLWFILLYWGRA
jgi:ubiquinol-cytochrome c reductase cytochrome b subunit